MINKKEFAKRLKYNPLKSRAGVALLAAITVLTLILYMATEVMYDTQVEYAINSQAVSKIKAYYAAKAGIDISLLRIKIFKEVQSKLGSQIGNAAMLDEIWKFPFAWPIPVPPEVNAVDKELIESSGKDSIMDATYLVTIEDEGSKIDINDLASPAKSIQEGAKNQLLQIFESKMKSDEEFQQKYNGYRFEELVNQIADWMSPKNTSYNGGDKRAPYSQLGNDVATPPNRGFRTVDELRLIAGMNDDFFDLLKPRITIYGMKGINPNYASKEVLLSLDSGMTEEAVKEIMDRRDSPDKGGPFKSADEFWEFAQSHGARLSENFNKTPIIFSSVQNFKIRSTAEFAGVTREITAIVMDINKAASTIADAVKKEKDAEKGSGTDSASPSGGSDTSSGGTNLQNNSQSSTETLPKGPPKIVYWNEK